MAVLLVLSIAGIFHRALHLHSSKHKSVFYRENSTTTAAKMVQTMSGVQILTIKLVQSVSGVLVPNLTKLSEQEPTPLLPFEVRGVDAEQGYYALGDC